LARAEFRNRHHSIQIGLDGKPIVAEPGTPHRIFKAKHVEDDIDTEGTV
jgi:hypothetical protein